MLSEDGQQEKRFCSIQVRVGYLTLAQKVAIGFETIADVLWVLDKVDALEGSHAGLMLVIE